MLAFQFILKVPLRTNEMLGPFEIGKFCVRQAHYAPLSVHHYQIFSDILTRFRTIKSVCIQGESCSG